MKKMKDLIIEMDKKVYAVERVIKKINELDSRKLADYYDKLYRIIIDHFLAYRLTATGFFHEKAHQFSTLDRALENICVAQPVV